MPEKPTYIRDALFGPRVWEDPDPQLDTARRSATESLSRGAYALRDTADRARRINHPLLADAPAAMAQLADGLAESGAAIDRAAGRPMRVVLMGRTMAGKSTLFEYLSGGAGARIGNGSQRYSRDVAGHAIPGYRAVIVDTPGVGAKDGVEDYLTAFLAADDADLIVWVNASNSLQQETARALGRLASSGTPLVVVINCRSDLNDPELMEDLRMYPDDPFHGMDGHVRRIQRFLDQHAQRPIAVIPAHLDAAWRSTQVLDGPEREFLRTASRIDALHDVLAVEIDQRSPQRRLLWQVDSARNPLLAAASEVQPPISDIDRRVDEERMALKDLGKRSHSVIELERARTGIRVHRAIDRHRDWADEHYNLSTGAISDEWAKVSQTLMQELNGILTEGADALTTALAQESTDVGQDWADRLEVKQAWNVGEIRGRHAGGRGRAKLAAAAAVAAPAAILAVPALLVGGAAGLALGAALGLVSLGVGKLTKKPLGNWLRGLSRKRRESLREQVQEQLSQLTDETDNAWEQVVQRAHAEIGHHIEREMQGLENVAQTTREIAAAAQRMEGLAREQDLVAARGMLALAGHPDLAASVREVHRRPGFLALLGVDEPTLVRTAMAPPEGCVEDLRFYPVGPAATPQRRLAHAAAVGSMPRRRITRRPGEGLIVRTEPQRSGVWEQEQDLLSRAAGVPVVVDTEPLAEGAAA